MTEKLPTNDSTESLKVTADIVSLRANVNGLYLRKIEESYSKYWEKWVQRIEENKDKIIEFFELIYWRKKELYKLYLESKMESEKEGTGRFERWLHKQFYPEPMTPPKYYSEEDLEEVFEVFWTNDNEMIKKFNEVISNMKTPKESIDSKFDKEMQALEESINNSEDRLRNFEEMEK